MKKKKRWKTSSRTCPLTSSSQRYSTKLGGELPFFQPCLYQTKSSFIYMFTPSQIRVSLFLGLERRKYYFNPYKLSSYLGHNPYLFILGI
jgi:hypothetical protein